MMLPDAWQVRRRRFRWAAVLAIVVLLACAILVSRGMLQPLGMPYGRLVDSLPASASLVQHKVVRHGLDWCELFEFSCSDTALRDALVRKWKLRNLTKSTEEPVSFVQKDRPVWWPSNTGSATRKFGRSDEKAEQYLSVWEFSATGRLYVENGQW